MNARLIWITTLVLSAAAAAWAQSPLGSAFTYQGQLRSGGSPANGSYDMEFSLWDDSVAGNQVGPTLTFDGAGGNPAPVSVANGLFTVQLDFGASYNGDRRWLEITVSGTQLSPREELTAVPHARISAAPWATSGANINYQGGNVGIGTSTPPQKLTVKADFSGGLDARQFLIQGATNSNQQLLMGYNTSDNYGSIQAVQQGTTVRPLALQPGGGNVGIGTTTPAQKLDVIGTARMNGFQMTSSPSAGKVLTSDASGNGTWQFVSAGGTAGGDLTGTFPNPTIAANAVTSTKLASDAASLNKVSGGAMTSTAGNVGIGTISPNGLLTLAYGGIGGPGDAAHGIMFSSSQAGGYGHGAIYSYDIAGFNADLVFATDGDGIQNFNPTEKMRIRYNGNVGIGTVSPSNKLSVAGAANFSGNVGIGTTSPNGLLTIAHSQMDQFGDAAHGIMFNSSLGGGFGHGAIYSDGNSNYDGDLVFATDGDGTQDFNPTEKMRIRYNGNVGIGTASPANRLSVSGNADISGNVAIGGEKLLGFNLSDTFIYDATSMGHYSVGWFSDSWSPSGNTAWLSGYAGIKFFTLGTPRMAINDAGNIGIGTTAPSQRLHVVGNICATGTIGACSDARFKRNVEPVTDALSLVERLRPVRFDWKRDEFCDHEFSEARQLGLIAQEVRKVAPEVVQEGSDGYLAVDYGRLTPLLVQALKELKSENDRFKAESYATKAKNAELEARLVRLESLISDTTARTGGAR